MNIYDYQYFCRKNLMYVSMGYCENCFNYFFHDGSTSWVDCTEKNLTGVQVNEVVNSSQSPESSKLNIE